MNKQIETRKALGKGLSALLPVRRTEAAAPAPAMEPTGAALEIPTDKIQANPLQPRQVFQPEKLDELAASIKANGIIQPVLVQKRGEQYQLIAGERRWRAAQIAGLPTIPAIVRDLADEKLLELALIENIQREDLNPIEVAQAFERLGKELRLSHEEIGQRTGKDRATITNLLRLLKLSEDIQLLVAEGRLSMGHARAILGLPTADLQWQVAERVIDEGMSVRQVEKLVQQLTKPPEEPAPAVEEQPQDPNVKAAAQKLEHVLGTRVRIVEKSPKRGRIEIEYYSAEELDRIYAQLSGE